MSHVNLKKFDAIAIVTLNRPDKLNTISIELAKELISVIRDLDSDDSVKVIIITGGGNKAFSAGADISYMHSISAIEAVEYAKIGQHLTSTIENCSKPTIAALNGYTMGGGLEIALACDLRIASETAKLGEVEVAIGVTPSFGGSQRLQRVVGIAKAKEMTFTARPVDANEAKEIGLVNQVVPLSNLIEESTRIAQMMTKNSAMGIKMSKIAINKGRDSDIDTGLAVELYVWGLCFTHPDRTERMTAFVNKSK